MSTTCSETRLSGSTTQAAPAPSGAYTLPESASRAAATSSPASARTKGAELVNTLSSPFRVNPDLNTILPVTTTPLSSSTASSPSSVVPPSTEPASMDTAPAPPREERHTLPSTVSSTPEATSRPEAISTPPSPEYSKRALRSSTQRGSSPEASAAARTCPASSAAMLMTTSPSLT